MAARRGVLHGQQALRPNFGLWLKHEREEGTGRLTRGSEWRNHGAGRLAVGSGGGARAALGEGLKEGGFGLLDGTDPLVARLGANQGVRMA